MNETMVSEDHAPLQKLLRPLIRALRTAYIQGTTVVKLMPSERAIQLYYSTAARVMICSGPWIQDIEKDCVSW